MSDKDCGNHDEKKRLLYILIGIGVFIIVAVGLAILIVWLILRPSNPQFYLQDYTLYSLNQTPPTYLTSSMQVTIATRNPNSKMGINFLNLDIYAAYREQQITLATKLPVTYLGHKESAVWSPYLIGNYVPISPYMADALTQDLSAGWLLLYVRISGDLKWKVGTWMSGHYKVQASCPAYLSFGHQIPVTGSANNGVTGGFGVKYQFVQDCTVDV